MRQSELSFAVSDPFVTATVVSTETVVFLTMEAHFASDDQMPEVVPPDYLCVTKNEAIAEAKDVAKADFVEPIAILSS